MSEMLERVARALWEARESRFPPRTRRSPDEFDRASGAWRMALEDARAAIEAIREPTEAMLAAVVPFPEHLRDEHASDPQWEVWMQAAVMAERMALRQRWIDLIDAVLSEPPAPERKPDHA